ncbi:hypothetical protein D3C79_986180 [compost metagenome]
MRLHRDFPRVTAPGFGLSLVQQTIGGQAAGSLKQPQDQRCDSDHNGDQPDRNRHWIPKIFATQLGRILV